MYKKKLSNKLNNEPNNNFNKYTKTIKNNQELNNLLNITADEIDLNSINTNLKESTELIKNFNKIDNEIKIHEWNDSFEKICINLIDEAQINTFLHQESYRYFSKWSRMFQIPIIILSALSGVGNFGSTYFDNTSTQDLIVIIIGCLSIFISMLSSVAQYLKLAECKENHRLSYFHWEKLFNKIRIQLMLNKDYRRKLPGFYDEIISEYDRLKEISPMILNKIKKQVLKKDGYDVMNVPFYLNGFTPVIPYEKAQENYRYYYYNNSQDRNIKFDKANQYIRPKKNKKNKFNQNHQNNNTNVDENITDPNNWGETAV